MWELLSSSSTPWVIVTISGIISAIWGFRKLQLEKKDEKEKLLYQNRLEKFKETNENLFKQNKQEVLAAIATLSIFKQDEDFEKNTIDVLLSRLYTELDYDIINSILSTLIQDSNKEELIYIAGGLQDINRNFFIQDTPMKQRIVDINKVISTLYTSIEKQNTPEFSQLVADKKADPEIFIRNKDEVEKKYNDEFRQLFSYQKYRSIWHKQVTADAYAMFMRKAYLYNRKEGLEMSLYQNDFNYVYMAELGFEQVNISRSALSYATITDIKLNNLNIHRTTFERSNLQKVEFKNGMMEQVKFNSVRFEEVLFENIHFKEVDFGGTDFLKTRFINCTGLHQKNFNDTIYYDEDCVFPSEITVEHIDSYKAKSLAAVHEKEKEHPLT